MCLYLPVSVLYVPCNVTISAVNFKSSFPYFSHSGYRTVLSNAFCLDSDECIKNALNTGINTCAVVYNGLIPTHNSHI